MNSGAAKACRADRKFSGVSTKIPRDFKRRWKAMTSRERGKLRKLWNVSQFLIGVEGEKRHQAHLEALRQVKAATVKLSDLSL